jgi:hypothetical protein
LQGQKKTAVEELPDTIAVRCRDAACEAQVRKALRGIGTVRAVASQRLLIVTLADPANRRRALEKLGELQDTGTVEFATPVLCDPSSRQHQILTDEITVRFKKPIPSAERLKKQYGVTVARLNEFVPNQCILKVTDSRGLKTLEVANRLDASRNVEFAAPNFISEFKRA